MSRRTPQAHAAKPRQPTHHPPWTGSSIARRTRSGNVCQNSGDGGTDWRAIKTGQRRAHGLELHAAGGTRRHVRGARRLEHPLEMINELRFVQMHSQTSVSNFFRFASA